MDKIFRDLNPQQKEAVLYDKGPLAIIAGAGSGKTRTISHKIAYLIIEKETEPSKILGVTFTNKAADELRDRVAHLVGPAGRKVIVKTYHSLCASILREEIGYFGYPKSFNIVDNIDQKQILRLGYKKYGLLSKGLPYGVVIEYISHAKNKGETPKSLLDKADKEIDSALAHLYDFYLKEMSKSKSLDFDDLLLFTYQLFKEQKVIARKWARKFDYLLVDEFQDTSKIQYNIIRYLSPNDNITVVGDPDQTIYSWRQSDPRLILNFYKNFKNSHIVLLEENYRSTPQILRAANHLITHNKNRIEKQLFTNKKDGDIIEYFHGFSEEAEARWVIKKIDELKKRKIQLKDIAIIYRANYLSNSLEKSLIDSNTNYVVFGGVKFYQRQEIKDVISYLKIINNGDEIAMKRMINIPSRKIGAAAQEKIFQFATQKQKLVFNAITDYFKVLPIGGASAEGLAKFMNLINKYRCALKSNSISLVIEKFLIEVKYNSIWSLIEDVNRFEAIKELILSIKRWERKNKGKKLSDFLHEISLYVDKDSSSSLKDYVSLMTAHTAKGLEFDNVFIYGFSEGIFPSKRSLDEGGKDALEEERRLAYVAVTRAKRRLFISSSRGFSIDYKTQKKPSRFINELGINIKEFTSEFIAPKNFNENYEKNRDLIAGDKVMHQIFGQGVVVNVQGELADIAFKSPHGVKTMMKNHKSIERLAR